MAAEDYMISCPTKKFLGFDCFGCGTQRAFAMLLEGDFKGAFDLFPAIYTLVLFVFFVALHFLDRSRSYSKILIALAIINAIVMVTSYFLKHPL